jgi:Phage portal protein, lambda family
VSLTYTCARCGGSFDSDWSDDEAAEELEENIPGVARADCAVVCDDCYQQMVAVLPPERPSGNFADFEEAVLRNVASAAGLSFRQVSNDWPDVNYPTRARNRQ